jgi:hypothetical protein
VAKYFDNHGLIILAFVKRWRCPNCGTVYTMRPCLYWRRFLTPVWMILASLATKQRHDLWLSVFTRQRQQYWWRGYNLQSHFAGPVVDLDTLEAKGIMVATHSLTDREVHSFPLPPYRSFAATAPPGYA